MQKFKAIGLMSGTSLDGVDVALIETDGFNHVRPLGFDFYPYEDIFRDQLRTCFGVRDRLAKPCVLDAEKLLTEKHAQAVLSFLKKNEIAKDDINYIGFHGQTIWHDPAAGETIQIGDGALLAAMTGISVVNDFRTADVKAGGEGAPLAPLYHRAMLSGRTKPIALINIGGVSNITWIGGDGDDEILAFDMGTGNALLDDWVLRHHGRPYDKDGALGKAGRIDQKHVDRFMAHPYFAKIPPKSLDRDAFAAFVPENLSVEDGAATLTAMTVQAIAHGINQLPDKPKVIYITGGGRHNQTMMTALAEKTGLAVLSVDDLGWKGDAIEAEAFGYLAVRSALGLPLSLPQTTSAPKPMAGGRMYKA